jgi:CBS-domain-containing membrane protein
MRRTVADVMTTDVVVARRSTPFKEVVRLMEERHIGSLPVVDDDGVEVLGVVSEADLLVKEQGLEASQKRMGRRRRALAAKAHALVAGDAMTSPAVTLPPETSVHEAARVMHERRLKHLPVVDRQGRLVGVVSRSDLLRVFLRTDDEIRREIVEEVLERTLWIDPATLEVKVVRGVVSIRGQVERKSLIPLVVSMIRAVDGVVEVEDLLSFELDDSELRADALAPWGVLPRSMRFP